MKKGYTGLNLVVDVILTLATGGLWLVVLVLIHLGQGRK